MVVMVAVGSWSLGHSSTVGIVYVFYGINLFFGINIYAGIKSIRPVRTGPIKFILFVNIPGLFSVYSGINRENKFYSNNGSHPVCRITYTGNHKYLRFATNVTYNHLLGRNPYVSKKPKRQQRPLALLSSALLLALVEMIGMN